MVKKKFIEKKSARHFHLVHRSQRDPLIADAEASDRVFKEITRGHGAANRQANHLSDIGSSDDEENHTGEAALFGVSFDDSEYDYTQHLRPIGNQGAIFLEAPTRERKEKKSSVQIKDDVSTVDESPRNPSKTLLPAEVLPSVYEMPIGLMNQPAVVQGLQPDMDPELREALEALELSDNEEEDDEEAEDTLDDDFIAQLDADADSNEDAFDFDVVGESDEDDYDDDENDDEGGWERRFLKFKQLRAAAADDNQSDRFETGSVGTGFSMSSSAMFRNEKLTMLDEQFDRIQEEYERNDDDEENDDDDDDADIDPKTGRRTHISIKQREDFEAILDDFLDKYEVIGKKMLPMLHGSAGEKLGAYRHALLVDEDDTDAGRIKEATAQLNERAYRSTIDAAKSIDMLYPQEKERDAWDCESILSTYSNLENHPGLIQEVNRRIRLSRKSGMPIVVEDGNDETTTTSKAEKTGMIYIY
ncbi:Low temperature viability protein-domain-containing protein [Syncephalis fuscata]|nr:Low temperature viability protein-domain-containing protein [Syncephalis fuscata]